MSGTDREDVLPTEKEKISRLRTISNLLGSMWLAILLILTIVWDFVKISDD